MKTKFKIGIVLKTIHGKKLIEWWTEDDCHNTLKEAEAFVWDPQDPEHMSEIEEYFNADNFIKLVTP